jgi:hypothetical protein
MSGRVEGEAVVTVGHPHGDVKVTWSKWMILALGRGLM